MNIYRLYIYDYDSLDLIKSFDVRNFYFDDYMLYAYTFEELSTLLDTPFTASNWSITVNLSFCFVKIFYIGDINDEEK